MSPTKIACSTSWSWKACDSHQPSASPSFYLSRPPANKVYLGFSLPESTAMSKNIGGYNVPPNTAVVIDTRRLNTDAVTWGPDGNTFRPERFTNMPRRTCQYGFMRFGVGAASGKCLGKNVADIVFKMTTLAVIARYMITNVKKEGVEEAVSPEILFTPV